MRYLKGTKHYALALAPRIQLPRDHQAELHCYVDSDWAGCRTTRKSTSGCVLQLLGCTIHAYSRTQGSIATSSGEAELYAIGSGASESLGVVNFLEESRLLPRVIIIMHTDMPIYRHRGVQIYRHTGLQTKRPTYRHAEIQHSMAWHGMA